jgi:hypothetical protein
MMNAALLSHSLFYGSILSAVLTILILGSLYINPEMWLQDAPHELQEKHGPMSAQAKRQRNWLVAAFAITLIGVIGPSLYLLPAVVGGPLTFGAVFIHIWVMFMIFNLVDLLLIDWLIVEFIRPTFIAQSPLGQLMAKPNYGFHMQAFLKGSVGILVASLLLAGLIMFFVSL